MKGGRETVSKPELLDIRWVCGLCLKVMHAPLDIEWSWDSRNAGPKGQWLPAVVRSPICHGVEMLILGKPKLDVFGLRSRGMTLDPLDNMICPIVQASK